MANYYVKPDTHGSLRRFTRIIIDIKNAHIAYLTYLSVYYMSVIRMLHKSLTWLVPLQQQP